MTSRALSGFARSWAAVPGMLLIAGVLLACGAAIPRQPEKVSGAECVPAGAWVDPRTREVLSTPAAMERAASSNIVLLGEHHDRPEHHLWQLQTIAGLHAHRPSIVIGFEMFPREVQAVLDQWVEGELDERDFLTGSRWAEVWHFPAELYLPLFRYARLNRVAMVALNVPRDLVSRVAREGWQAVPPAERAGLSDPAPPTAAYESLLREQFERHLGEEGFTADSGAARFVEAQLVWDAAFAQALHDAADRQPEALVIGVVGGGHLEHGYGVPHQLRALGLEEVTVLLPWESSADCAELAPDLADAVFGVVPWPAAVAPRPMLGVRIEATEEGVAILDVVTGSVAAQAGVERGDIIVEAAGLPIGLPSDLQEIVRRQAPGTWLPLRVHRGPDELELVARFPAHP